MYMKHCYITALLTGLLVVSCCMAQNSKSALKPAEIRSARAWLTRVANGVTPTESNLLQHAQSTLLGNVIEDNAWKPYRGIEPSLGMYRGIWNWDAAFHAIGVSHWDASLAREQINIIFGRQLKNGMLPDVIWDIGNTNGTINYGNTKPPVMAWAVAIVDHRSPDTEFLRQIYPKLIKLGEFWLKNRGGERDGLFYYAGQDVGWDSGWDDSIRWDDGYRKSKNDDHRLWAVDLNCYMYMHYRAMAYLAGRLGLVKDKATWVEKADALAKLINTKLWDERIGFYVDRDRVTGKRGPALSPAGFMPLFVHIASKKQAAQCEQLARDPQKFFPGMPTAAYDTPGYDAAQMWRGPAWLNTSFFALKGLQEYGYTHLADTMRSTILDWVARNPSSIREFYNSKTGDGLGAPRFGWSAVFTISFIVDWNNDNLTWPFRRTQNDVQ
jgi:glucosidase